jgi:chemotaxis protein CheX
MPDHLQMDACLEDVARTVASVFGAMVDLDLTVTQASFPPEEDLLSAAVYYAGAWKGALLLECTPRQARLLTARLTKSEPPPGVNAEVRDALGELANMIAGNLKPQLPHGVFLSMPSLIEGSDYTLWMCGGNRVGRVAFASQAGVFWVSLVEMLDAPGDSQPSFCPRGQDLGVAVSERREGEAWNQSVKGLDDGRAVAEEAADRPLWS